MASGRSCSSWRSRSSCLESAPATSGTRTSRATPRWRARCARTASWIVPHLNGRIYSEKPPLHVLVDRRRLVPRRRRERDRRASAGGGGRARHAAPALRHRRAPVRPPRRLVVGADLRHLGQDPLAGADRPDRHAADRARDARALVLRARPGPRSGRCFYRWFFVATGLATLAKGPVGLLPPLLAIVVWAIASGRRDVLRAMRIPTGLAIWAASRPGLAGAGGAGRRPRVPRDPGASPERDALRRPLAPLPTLVLLPDGDPGRLLPLVVLPPRRALDRLEADLRRSAARLPACALLDGGDAPLLQPLAGEAHRLRPDHVPGDGARRRRGVRRDRDHLAATEALADASRRRSRGAPRARAAGGLARPALPPRALRGAARRARPDRDRASCPSS